MSEQYIIYVSTTTFHHFLFNLIGMNIFPEMKTDPQTIEDITVEWLNICVKTLLPGGKVWVLHEAACTQKTSRKVSNETLLSMKRLLQHQLQH